MKTTNLYCGKVDSQGGSKISLLNLIFLLDREQKPINIFVSNKGWFTQKLDEKGISYTVFKEPSVFQASKKETSFISLILSTLWTLPYLIRNWIKIDKCIGKKENVIINEPRDLLLFFPFLVRKKVNLIQWVRSEQMGFISSLISKRVDKVITVTDIVKNNVVSKTNKKVYTIHNFMFNKPVKTNKKQIISKQLNLAVIGSIQKIKGQLDAVRMLEYLPENKNIKLYIIGREFDQLYTELLKEYITDKKLNSVVEFVGHIDQIPDYLSEHIHLTIIPSQTESFCRVAMESLSVGVPVIAYSVGGLKEVILHERTGYLIEKDNIKKMGETVNHILSSNQIYNDMRAEAVQDWNKRFHAENIKKEVFEILK